MAVVDKSKQGAFLFICFFLNWVLVCLSCCLVCLLLLIVDCKLKNKFAKVLFFFSFFSKIDSNLFSFVYMVNASDRTM